jgi:hypothetical protein
VTAELPKEVEVPLDEVAPRSCTLYGGAQVDAVECCAFPGNGSFIVTGIDIDDFREQPVNSFNGMTMQQMQRRKQFVRAGVLQSLIYLRRVEKEEWFQQLRGGTRRFDLKRMMLSYLDKHAKERKEVKGDLHIHFRNANKLCSAFTGAATALVIAQVMTGYMLFRKVAALGEVTSLGELLPTLKLPEITLTEVDAYLVAEYEGDNVCIKPKGPPQLVVKGFSHLKDMLTYAFHEDAVSNQKPQRAGSEEDNKKIGGEDIQTQEAEGEGPMQP